MAWRLLRAVLILPGTALVLVPGLLLWLSVGTDLAAVPAGPGDLTFWLGLVSGSAGLLLAVWTMRLFVVQGRGTPAPWDPPRRLVVSGPYRHVRNPMLTGVLLLLLAEALVLRSWPIGAWMLVFFIGNTLYFALFEEKALERRFGAEYRTYKTNVPRWLPRLRPWDPCQGERSAS